MAVLYVYVIRIAFLTELPRGGVCWMVNAFMLGLIAIVILLYPQQHASAGHPEELRSFELRAMRWMPFLALPLLVLMSIAIGRRIMDYGITVNRLYMATLRCLYRTYTVPRASHPLDTTFVRCTCIRHIISSRQFLQHHTA